MTPLNSKLMSAVYRLFCLGCVVIEWCHTKYTYRVNPDKVYRNGSKMREKISPIRDERTLSICLCADAIHTSPAYYFLATGGGRRSVADIKPVGDVARDMPV